MAPEDSGLRFAQTATNATSAVATQTGSSGKKSYITDISGSSDKAGALILVKDGTTVIWQERISNTTPYQHTFRTPLVGTAGNDVSVTVDGTAIANANIAGFVL